MKPVLQALVLAEHVYEDTSGRKIIVGTFNTIRQKKTEQPREIVNPDGTKAVIVHGGQSGSPYAYISLTDVCDGTVVRLQFVSLRRNKVIFGTDLTIECKDRLRTIEIVAALPHLFAPEPGVYAFELVCEGEIIGSLRVQSVHDD